tara:strand:+ start:1491 stop:3716 length:2226 start_codon:yes stop_codon:yes gene_type:complete
MDARTIRRAAVTMIGVVGVSLSAAALFLLSWTPQNSDDYESLHIIILLINIAGVLVLFGLAASNLLRLLHDYRRKVPGSKLKARMVRMFVGLALLPLLVVFYFSMQFINSGIDSWFNIEVEDGLDEALALSQAALGIQMRDHLSTTARLASALQSVDTRQLIFELSRLRREAGAAEISIFGSNGRIIATSSDRPAGLLPSPLTEEVHLQIRQNRPYVSLDPADDGNYEIRTAVSFGNPNLGGVFQALYAVPERISLMANSVESSNRDYKRAAYIREPLKRNFSLTLTVVLLLSLLGAIYGAFVLSRRLVEPIQDLVAGTRAVAEGDFDTKLPAPTRDEIGFLISSFNEMTQRLSGARREARLNQALVEAERTNLAVILDRLSTGVVALEPDLRIRVANAASGSILNVDLEKKIGKFLPNVADGQPLLQQFVDIARFHLDRGETEWREQIVLSGEVGRRVLTCACTALPGDEDNNIGGYVVVFDDITALLQAQRDAAWGEVARRLAHEIKNPLTPIQLSAERMRRKYLQTLPEADAQLLDRATHTIVQQVEAMKEMVNAFSDYARAPDIDLDQFNIEVLVHEVVDLYRGQEIDIEIILKTASDMPRIEADAGRVRQIMHNLLRNSVEALELSQNGTIEVDISAGEFHGVDVIEIVVADNGPGFKSQSLNQVFDPYVTTKPKGTGLGLAIVKKLVEEHAGTIEAENLTVGGAMIRIQLPIDEISRGKLIAKLPGRVEQGRAKV